MKTSQQNGIEFVELYGRAALMQLELDGVAADLIQGLRESLETLNQLTSDLNKAHGNIAANDRVNDKGRTDLLAACDARALQNLNQLEAARVKSYDGYIAQLQSKLKPTPASTEDPAAAAARWVEYRAFLRTLDPMVVTAEYMEAAQTGADPLLEAAVETWPALERKRFVLPEIIAAAGQARAVRNNPENSKLISDAIAVRKAYVDAVASVRSSLSVPTEDPVARLAASMA